MENVTGEFRRTYGQTIEKLEKENTQHVARIKELEAEVACEERRFNNLHDQFAYMVSRKDELEAQLARCINSNVRTRKQARDSLIKGLHQCDSTVACRAIVQRIDELAKSLPTQAKANAEDGSA